MGADIPFTPADPEISSTTRRQRAVTIAPGTDVIEAAAVMWKFVCESEGPVVELIGRETAQGYEVDLCEGTDIGSSDTG